MPRIAWIVVIIKPLNVVSAYVQGVQVILLERRATQYIFILCSGKSMNAVDKTFAIGIRSHMATTGTGGMGLWKEREDQESEGLSSPCKHPCEVTPMASEGTTEEICGLHSWSLLMILVSGRLGRP